ncbi:hypothetical protein CLOSTASPAR_04141 [[Clostridium] asparagiforme DSM 15981]|uniref:Uncharacterized protein n=1 Tax=[Clostridium] asparagiforme DSM 15981 TaxID=518636 RepID=C0D4E7_9FIRM|nr:hypothetical protein CLOSTASPAR_04141 [[Clostridium] asparagiforme DSM 15981]
MKDLVKCSYDTTERCEISMRRPENQAVFRKCGGMGAKTDRLRMV